MVEKKTIMDIIEKSIRVKCHHTLQYGWYDGVHYLKDTNNSRKIYDMDEEVNVSEFKSKDGRLESIESEIMDNTDFTDDEILAYQRWICPDYQMITEYQRLLHSGQGVENMDFSGTSYETLGKYFEEWSREYFDEVADDITYTVDNLEGMFNKSKLSENLRVFRGGQFDANLNVGDVSSFDTCVSTSFKENIARGYTGISHHKDTQRYMITILAPKGTKALIGTEKFSTGDFHKIEHELTLNNGQKFEVITKDDNATPPTVTIKLIND